MWQRWASGRLLAAALIMALPAPWFSVLAEPGTARLSGVIQTRERVPLAGVRVLAADPERGSVRRSEPTSAEGEFTLAGLEPATYELAVETDGGIYLVGESLYLVEGVKREVQIVVGEQAAPAAAHRREARPSVWDNPYTAGAIVLGAAIVVGVLVNQWTEDESNVSP